MSAPSAATTDAISNRIVSEIVFIRCCERKLESGRALWGVALLPNLVIRTGTDTYPVHTKTMGMLICIGGVFHICTVGLHPMAPVVFFGCIIML